MSSAFLPCCRALQVSETLGALSFGRVLSIVRSVYQPEARGSAEETQMTPLESTQNRHKINPKSTKNRQKIDRESIQIRPKQLKTSVGFIFAPASLVPALPKYIVVLGSLFVGKFDIGQTSYTSRPPGTPRRPPGDPRRRSKPQETPRRPHETPKIQQLTCLKEGVG